MANDVSNLILKKMIEMKDSETIYLFNHNLYKQKVNTNYDDFIKEIIKLNYEKCVKIIFKRNNKIGPYVDYRGPINGNLCVENWDNEIDISSFEITREEYERLYSRFIECKWSVCISSEYCHHDRTCHCFSQRNFIFKNEEDDKREFDNYYENEPNDRIVWGNVCQLCDCFIDDIRYIRSDQDICNCPCNIHICNICKPPAHIIVRPNERYYSDTCGLFKDDVYAIFTSSNINIFKEGCVNIIKRHIIAKKIIVI